MEITWHGHNCFSIKGSSGTAVLDPYGDIGIKLPSLKANVATISQDDSEYNNTAALQGDPKVFSWPGEYEASGILVTTIEGNTTKGKKTLITHVEVDGIRIVHLGSLGEKPTEQMVEALGDVDILILPVGGREAFDHKAAHAVIEQIEPRVVIPMHYQTEGMTLEVNPVDAFLKEVGNHSEPQDKYSLKGRSGLPDETMDVVILNAQCR